VMEGVVVRRRVVKFAGPSFRAKDRRCYRG
jgi:hypothetical protein